MNSESQLRLKQLLISQRVLSLAVLIEGQPHLGLLPYALKPDFTAALVHASTLARHTRGLTLGAPFSCLIHAPDDPASDPLQIPRLTINGEVFPVDPTAPNYRGLSEIYLHRFPQSEVTFGLGDFVLFELRFRAGRFVEGFAAASNVTLETLQQIAAGSE